MCIIIDQNTFASIFSEEAEDHAEFVHLRKWLYEGKNSKMVYGGTDYRKELKQATRYQRYFRRLRDVNRVLEIDDEKVDEKQREIKQILSSIVNQGTISENDKRRKFNDSHIVAIAIVSKCKLVCTKDGGLKSFLNVDELRKKGFFPKSRDIPLIYSKHTHNHLLYYPNITDPCK